MRWERAVNLAPGTMVAVRKGPAWEALPAQVLPAPDYPTKPYVVERWRKNWLAVRLQVPSGFMGLPEFYRIETGDGWSRRAYHGELADPTDVWVQLRCVVDEEIDQERAVARAARVASDRSAAVLLAGTRDRNHQTLANMVRDVLENSSADGRVSIDTARIQAGELVVTTYHLDRVGEALGHLLAGRQVTLRVSLADDGSLPERVQ